jgi:hypothetical protein
MLEQGCYDADASVNTNRWKDAQHNLLDCQWTAVHWGYATLILPSTINIYIGHVKPLQVDNFGR